MKNRLIWKLASAVLCIILFLAVTYQVRSANNEAYFQSLLTAYGMPTPPSLDLKKLSERNQRARQLYQIWTARSQRNIVAEVVPYLQDDEEYLRTSAARMLGRLENPEAEPELSRLLRKMSGKLQPGTKFIRPETLKLALGRIHSKGLTGKAKAEAVASEVDLSFNQVARLSQKLDTPERGRHLYNTPAYEIVTEMVDVLYQMGKRGENIQPLASSLTLKPAQQLKLQAAPLSTKQEVELIIDYISQLKVLTAANANLCIRHLASLEPQASNLILERLTEIKNNPEKFPDTRTGIRRTTLFRAAALTGDPRMIPLLKHFEQDSNTWIRNHALSSRSALEKQAWPPPLPYRE